MKLVSLAANRVNNSEELEKTLKGNQITIP